jgi:hypothetical protein
VQFGVEVGERLVEEGNFGLLHQRAADRDALLDLGSARAQWP